MEEMNVNIAAKDGNYTFRMFRPFVAFVIIQNNVRLRIDTREDKIWEGKIICMMIISQL
jgi:hypothetical protein